MIASIPTAFSNDSAAPPAFAPIPRHATPSRGMHDAGLASEQQVPHRDVFARLMRSNGLDPSDLAPRVESGAATVDPRHLAAQLVSTLFYAPLLAEMRKFSIGTKFGSGGQTEEVFGEQLDRHIADAVAISDHGGLTDILARQLSPRDGRQNPELQRPAVPSRSKETRHES